jgi:hypothetical protein
VGYCFAGSSEAGRLHFASQAVHKAKGGGAKWQKEIV